MPECVFCRLCAENPDLLVLDEDDVVAFLDSKPVFHGHVLVCPRRHVPDLDALPGDLAVPLWSAVQRVSGAVQAALGAQGAFVAVNNKVSQSVPHLHVHIVPRRQRDGLRGFFWPRVRYRDDAHVEEVRAALRATLSR